MAGVPQPLQGPEPPPDFVAVLNTRPAQHSQALLAKDRSEPFLDPPEPLGGDMGTVTGQGGGSEAEQPGPKATFGQVSIHPASGFSCFFCGSSPFSADSDGSCTSSVRN